MILLDISLTIVMCFCSCTRISHICMRSHHSECMFILIFLCFQYTDYQEVSKGYGGKGFLVSDDSSDLSSILKSAQSLCQEGHTVLVNALIGSSKFREGSISV